MKPRRILIAFALLAWFSPCEFTQSAEPGVCYDMSVDGTLAKYNPHVKRAEGVYHLWALHKPGVLTDSIYWARARKAAAEGKFVWLNIEPDQSSVLFWRRPLNTLPELTTKFPQPVTLAQVESTHLLISRLLGPLCDQAKISGSQVWDYRTLQVNSLELSVSDYARWKAETERIVGINDRAIASRLHDTGGGIIYEIYVPQQWNVPNHWLQTKAVIALERHAAIYDQLGVRSMPLLNPMTVGADGGKPVRVELLNSLIQSARSRGDWGWWSEAGKTTPALAKEVGAWIK